MNRTRRCLYNAIRDAAAADGMARVASWDDLADICQVMPRQAQETTSRLDRDGLLVRCGNPREKCFVPLDPDATRREAFFAALHQTQYGLVAMARLAFLRSQGVSVMGVCGMLATPCSEVEDFDDWLHHFGYFGET